MGRRVGIFLWSSVPLFVSNDKFLSLKVHLKIMRSASTIVCIATLPSRGPGTAASTLAAVQETPARRDPHRDKIREGHDR